MWELAEVDTNPPAALDSGQPTGQHFGLRVGAEQRPATVGVFEQHCQGVGIGCGPVR